MRLIPRGRVTTYGHIARLAGIPRQSRRIGYALYHLGNDGVPWHRVINARGEISRRGDPDCETIQRRLLETEGIRIDVKEKISFDRYGWFPEKI